jgi:hypothetical protein
MLPGAAIAKHGRAAAIMAVVTRTAGLALAAIMAAGIVAAGITLSLTVAGTLAACITAAAIVAAAVTTSTAVTATTSTGTVASTAAVMAGAGGTMAGLWRRLLLAFGARRLGLGLLLGVSPASTTRRWREGHFGLSDRCCSAMRRAKPSLALSRFGSASSAARKSSSALLFSPSAS